MTMTRRTAFAFALAVLVTGGAGCAAGGRPPRLTWPGDGNGGGAALPATHANHPYSFGALLVCLDRPGHVAIEKVTVDKPDGGLRVSAYATRPNPGEVGGEGLGNAPKKLHDVGFNTSSVSITTHCSDHLDYPNHRPDQEYHLTELAVEFVKPSEATAQGHGLTVTYRTGKHMRTLHIPFDVVLCGPGGKRDHEYCP